MTAPRATLWIWVVLDEVRGTGPDAQTALGDAERRLTVACEAAQLGPDDFSAAEWSEKRVLLHQGYPLEVRGHLPDLARTTWLCGGMAKQVGDPIPDPLHWVRARQRVYRRPARDWWAEMTGQ